MSTYACVRRRFGSLESRAASRERRAAGFTLIELLIVLALISILATMGVVQYRNGVRHTQESVLRTDLFGVGRSDPPNQLTAGRVVRHDDPDAVLHAERALLRVEAKLGLASGLVGAVAVVAVLRQDRQHVARVVHRLRRGDRHAERQPTCEDDR